MKASEVFLTLQVKFSYKSSDGIWETGGIFPLILSLCTKRRRVAALSTGSRVNKEPPLSKWVGTRVILDVLKKIKFSPLRWKWKLDASDVHFVILSHQLRYPKLTPCILKKRKHFSFLIAVAY